MAQARMRKRNYEAGQKWWFEGRVHQIAWIDFPEGTPNRMEITIRLVQKWWSFPAPPFEYKMSEARADEVLTPYVG